jgi:hypothetical protein
MALHDCMASHQHAIYIYVSPNNLLASPTHLFFSFFNFSCSPFVVDVYFVVTLSREPGASSLQRFNLQAQSKFQNKFHNDLLLIYM